MATSLELVRKIFRQSPLLATECATAAPGKYQTSTMLSLAQSSSDCARGSPVPLARPDYALTGMHVYI